jgi:hypothetical protein
LLRCVRTPGAGNNETRMDYEFGTAIRPIIPVFTFSVTSGIFDLVAATSAGDACTKSAVVVERQTRYLEGVVPTGREGSNPSDRIRYVQRR